MRAELVRARNPFYEERYAPFEDSHVCLDLLRTWNFGFVHQVLVFSRRDNESILLRIAPYRFELFSYLEMVIDHGRKYLPEDEYGYLVEKAKKEYFSFLGRAALEGRDAEFWKFHRRRLSSINYTLDFAFMTKWVLYALIDDIGNPKRTGIYVAPQKATFLSRFPILQHDAPHVRTKAHRRGPGKMVNGESIRKRHGRSHSLIPRLSWLPSLYRLH